MFNSVSACTPDSLVSTSFVSTQTQLLNISSNVTVSINETVISSRPITISVDDRVSATVTSPPGYLGYEFYEYYINGVQQYFAVVNKNNYHPTVKSVDATKKWFNYLPTELSISFYYSTFNIQRPLGVAHGIVDIEKTHIVLDHINDSVLFYTTTQTLATRVKLPAGPVEYRKISYTDPVTNQLTTEAIVLCGNKRLYRIIFNNRYFDSDTFSPTVVQAIGLSGLWYEQDTPTGQSFIDARRSYIRSKLNPDVTALDISSITDNIWIAGYDSVFILSKTFQEINRVILTRETIVSLACIGNDAIVTTRLGKAYYITSTGTVTLIYQTAALGNPCTIDSSTAVVIADPNNQRLLRFVDASGTYTVIETPDINPAYPRIFDGVLWVTGYDSNQVLKISGSTIVERLNFDDKVTLVSVVGTSILATHYLQEFVTLDLTDIVKVIPFPVKFKKGPISHIGTEPIELKMLGQESIMPVAGPGLTYWVNGSYGQMANTGDYLNISFKATGNGVFRRPFIVGETAFDYNVEASSSVLITDYYKPNVVTGGITGNVTTELIPQTGNTWFGYTGPLDLGFTWNMYGTVYSNISVSTTGTITFGNTTPNLVPGFGNLNVDALYVETTPVYQRLPITNVNPLNVGYRQVATTQPMGVYYNSGSAGNFEYFKVRWVGITADPYPDGNTISMTTTITGSTDIPVDDLTVANIGDYVSGNGITVSTRVTGLVSTPVYTANVISTVANTSSLLLDTVSYNLNSLLPYSKVTNLATSAFTYLTSANYYQSSFNPDNAVTHKTGNAIYIRGHIDPNIDSSYRIILPYPFTGNGPSTSFSISSVTQTDRTTPYTYIGQATTNFFDGRGPILVDLIEVSQDFYDNAPPLPRQAYLDGNPASVVTVGRNRAFSPISPRLYIELQNFLSVLSASGTISYFETEVVSGDNLANVVFSPGSQYPIFEKVELTVVDSSIINSGPIEIEGKFIQVTPNVTIAGGTSLLFKTDLPMPVEHTYEVAFYVGRTYQFLEYYYKNSNHSAGANIGVSSSNAATLSTSVTSGPNNSIVFFSPANSGNWSYTGPGYIDPVAKIFLPRFPVIVNSEPEFGTQARIEFVIDQAISPTASVLLSTSFGYLTVNDGVYSGNTTIKENDTVSLTVPFNNSLSTVVPVISIGDYQFAIPMQSISAPSSYIETTSSYTDQLTNDYVTGEITVPVSDSYYLPDYYRVSGSPFIFTRKQAGGSETPIDAGLIYDFNAGDIITVYNQITPGSLYDRREIVLASPSFVVRTSWETSAGPIFDTLDFGTLVEPYVDNYEYTFTNYLGTNLISIDPEIYETANVTLTANTAITGNLYIDIYSSNIVVNGTDRGTYATNVSTGANIALTRKLMYYFQDDIIVYQVKYDTAINSNVYIPIGSWNIDNKIISGAVKEKNYSVGVGSVTAQETEYSYSVLTGEQLDPKFRQESVIDTNGIEVDSMPFDGTYFDLNRIAPESMPSESTYSLIGQVSGGMLPSSYLNIGSINAKRTGLYSYFSPPKISAIMSDRYGYLKFSITEYSSITRYTEIRLGPIVPINADRYTMFMLGGGINEVLLTPNLLEGKLEVVTEVSKNSLLEFDITSDLTQGSSITPDVLTVELNLSSSLPAVERLTIWDNPASLFETTLYFGSEVNSSFVRQFERFEWLFSDFGVSLPTFEFIQGYDDIATSFTVSNGMEFIKNYSYLEQKTAIPVFIKNASFIVNEKLDFVNYEPSTESSIAISSEHLALDTILLGPIVTANYEGLATILDSLTLIAKYQGLDTMIKKSLFVGRAENKENQFLLDISPHNEPSSRVTFLIGLEPAHETESISLVDAYSPIKSDTNGYLVDSLPPVQDIEPEYLVDLLPVQDIEPGYLVDLLPVQDIEPEYLIDLLPVQDIEPEYLIDLLPVQDIEPEYLIDLLPVQDIEPEYLIDLLPVRDIEPKILIPLPAVLDADIIWTMDPFTRVGAYKTYIRIWADQGRDGDQVTSMGTPANYGPLIDYGKLYNYSYGGQVLTEGEAIIEKGKYYSAETVNIATTDYWNYRIFFNNRHFCVPRKGKLFPVTWYIRGG